MQNKKTIAVHHQNENGGFHHVATIMVDPKLSDNEALEYAWRWTNNINGSWSRRDIADNSDSNPAVMVMAKLRTDKNGKVWGLRSSMMGDIFVLDDVPYMVAAIGFQKLETVVLGETG